MKECCKYCKSPELYLDANGEDIMTADHVALKCKACGRWLKWVAKADRKKYADMVGWKPETKAVEEKAEEPIKTAVKPAESPETADKAYAKKELYKLYNDVKGFSFLLREDFLTIIIEHIKALDTEPKE